ncbi:MAG: acyl-CoA dehydrogenase family protein [Acidimicrobiia bacterium]|nr:acyl-CoA dehydrogenase family protein [Acidimicrobiia bacterium]
MDLRYTDADEAFRAELRSWLESTLQDLPAPPARDDWAERRRYDTDWQRRLHDAGYAGLNWPERVGGRAASPSEQLIFLEETTRARAPYVGVNFVGTLHAGPTLIAEASEEQQERYLPSILRGDEVWCQGFSEPTAGSDLASLRTKAVRDGDEYVVNGQKIWCSFAQVADFCELLVRTDPEAKKQAGITWLILPMDSPGIEIRPIDTVAGSSEFAEVFLGDVRVPVANRVGDENDGWRITQVTFSFERGTAFVSELVDARRLANELAVLARRAPRMEGSAWDDATVRRELGHIVAELDALWALTKRNVSQAERTGSPGPGSMMIKLAYSEARQRLGELSLRVLDRAALAFSDDLLSGADELLEERLRTLALTIAAGTSQIQRNIIAERVLGLPRK